MRAVAIVAVVASTASAAPRAAKLVRAVDMPAQNNRFAFERKLGFADDDHYVAITECRDGDKASKLYAGTTTAAPTAVATLHTCEGFVGDGVVVELGYTETEALIYRRGFDGAELAPFELPSDVMVVQILAADPTMVIARAWDDRDDKRRVLSLALITADGTERRTTPAMTSKDQQPNAVVRSGDKLWVSTVGGDKAMLDAWDRDERKTVDAPEPCSRMWAVSGGEVVCASVHEGGDTTLARLDASGHARWSHRVEHSLASPVGGTGAAFVVSTETGLVRFAADGTSETVTTGIPDTSIELALSPNGKLVLAASRDGKLRLWRL